MIALIMREDGWRLHAFRRPKQRQGKLF
ncbi:hypothetical protein BOSEA31B_12481 [Hyphomicrobiales bacterium]|nr:hypothetical protein BOSEA31B_12481 [Hyphomicrobiales bacterium]CAH1698259.1 hypothetical protein BOSEA1005_11304 [Hyphomicrobiales bacterium]CAI0341925.1 hypothetical protein BO1005MUT1_100015 [Hyphomicrobiales bacterium]